LSGEPLTGVRTAGIFCVLLGAIVVARGEKAPDAGDTEAMNRSGAGIDWAILAGIDSASFSGFWNADRAASGRHAEVWMIRLTSAGRSRDFDFLRKQPMRCRG